MNEDNTQPKKIDEHIEVKALTEEEVEKYRAAGFTVNAVKMPDKPKYNITYIEP